MAAYMMTARTATGTGANLNGEANFADIDIARGTDFKHGYIAHRE